MNQIEAICPICCTKKLFKRPNSVAMIDRSVALDCPYKYCFDKERALAFAIRQDFSTQDIQSVRIHDFWTSLMGLSRWLAEHNSNYVKSGFFPEEKFGEIFYGFRNENAEEQSFKDNEFHIVFHSHSLEHFPNVYEVLREIYRTLVPGGKFYFYGYTLDTLKTKQLALIGDTEIVHIEKARYHEDALVFWKFGQDFAHLISEETNFDVEVRRFKSKAAMCFSELEEIFILTKPLY